MAALLSAIVDLGLGGAQNRKDLRGLSAESLRGLLAHAAWAAAVTVSRPGANPPTRAELNRMELGAQAPHSTETMDSHTESAELPSN
jgi:fructokinase